MPGHLRSLETPVLCLDLTVLQQRIDQVARQIDDCGKLWRPCADWHLLPQISGLQCAAGARGIAIDSISQAQRFIDAGISSLHLSRPPMPAAALQQQLQDQPQLEISVACDHYIQAEAISRIGCEVGWRIPVLLELNAGRHRSGVRPGLDGRDLARGASRLPGIEIRGIETALGTLGPEEHVRAESAAGMLSELKQHLIQDGICCETVSVSVEGNITPLLQCEAVTELRTGNFFTGTLDLSSPLSVMATIFSRSKLERAVLDVGRAHLGSRESDQLRVRKTALGRSLPDASITQVGWDSLTLELGSASRDVMIGDQIEVELLDGTLALRLFPKVLVLRHGSLVATWSAAASR